MKEDINDEDQVVALYKNEYVLRHISVNTIDEGKKKARNRPSKTPLFS